MSHDPSEIILICWFAQETLLIVINVDNTIVETVLFSGFVDEQSIQKNSIYLKSKSFVKCPSGGGWEDGRHAQLHAVQTEWESAPFCVCVRWPERSGFCTLETVSSCSNPNLWYPATEMYCVGSNGWWGTGARWVLLMFFMSFIYFCPLANFFYSDKKPFVSSQNFCYPSRNVPFIQKHFLHFLEELFCKTFLWWK